MAKKLKEKPAVKKRDRSDEAERRKKRAAAEYSREKHASIRNIGEIPPIVNWNRRNKCKKDLLKFIYTYAFADKLPFCEEQLVMVSRMQDCILHGGKYILAIFRGAGKALDLSTPIPTPTGWTTMGEINNGDELFDEGGNICRVTQKHEVLHGRNCYKVIFSDGEEIVCDENHLWTVDDLKNKKPNITIRTKDMLDSGIYKWEKRYKEHRYAIRMQNPLQLPDKELPIDPYLLGVWLGDGSQSCNCISLFEDDAEEIIKKIEDGGGVAHRRGEVKKSCQGLSVNLKADYIKGEKHNAFIYELKNLGLINNKHIPDIYKRASYKQRLELLHGIMDTDGHITKRGGVELTLKKEFAEHITELLSSVGVKHTYKEKWVNLNGKRYGPYLRYHIAARSDVPLFALKRKSDRQRTDTKKKQTSTSRFIVGIEKVESRPVQCISVDSESRLYLCGTKMVPTHNSSLTELAVLWAILYGHKKFVPLITANTPRSKEAIQNIKTLLSTPIFIEDFPEVCYPIMKLDNVTQRASGQMYTLPKKNPDDEEELPEVRNTSMKFSATELVLPTVDGAFDSYKKPKYRKNLASGSKITSCGITSSAIRGMRLTLADGSVIRPDFCVLDDIQDEESAHSPIQVLKRLDIIQKAVLKSAGHQKEMAVIMPCTVIAKNDVVDKLLDKKNYASWQGEKIPFLYSWSNNHKMWIEEYADLRNTYDDKIEGDFQRARNAANEYYIANRAAMDEGCKVAWEHCYNENEISAIQHAYNSLIDDGEDVFASEFQNDPIDQLLDEEEIQLTTDQVHSKCVSSMKRMDIPETVEKITAFVDVQAKSLYWMICGFSMNFTSYILDYGVYPQQGRKIFKASEVNPTLFDKYKGLGQEGVWYAGLMDLTNVLASKKYMRQDGAELPMSRLLIDMNDGNAVGAVQAVCKNTPHQSIIMPQRGLGVTASSKPFNEYVKKRGDRIGNSWRIQTVKNQAQKVRHILSDTNHWKTFVRERIKQGIGDAGSLTIYGTPKHHPMLIMQLLSEYSVLTTGRGRSLYEWRMKPGHTENHMWDGLVGCFVAAAEQGCQLKELHIGKTVSGRSKLSAKDRLSKLGRVISA